MSPRPLDRVFIDAQVSLATCTIDKSVVRCFADLLPSRFKAFAKSLPQPAISEFAHPSASCLRKGKR